MPENEVDSHGDVNVSPTVDVTQSDRQEVTAETVELIDESEENNTAENDDGVADDVQNMTGVDDVEDDVMIGRLQQQAKRVPAKQVIHLGRQSFCLPIRRVLGLQCFV